MKLPFASARLILSHKRLMIWASFPIIVTFALYWYVIGAAQEAAMQWLEGIFAENGMDPTSWLFWLVSFLAQIALIIISAVTFAFTSSIVASPFNDFLAESTEKYAQPQLPIAEGSGVKHQVRLILIDLGKACAATAAAVVAILFSWVPILNIVAFAVTFLLICFQYTSYPQTRRNIGLKDGLKFLLRHPFACGGFGMMITGMFAIPLASTLALPLAVVGGTLLVARAPGDGQLFPLK